MRNSWTSRGRLNNKKRGKVKKNTLLIRAKKNRFIPIRRRSTPLGLSSQFRSGTGRSPVGISSLSGTGRSPVSSHSATSQSSVGVSSPSHSGTGRRSGRSRVRVSSRGRSGVGYTPVVHNGVASSPLICDDVTPSPFCSDGVSSLAQPATPNINDSVIVLDDDSNDASLLNITQTVSSSSGEQSGWSTFKSTIGKRKLSVSPRGKKRLINGQSTLRKMIHSTPIPIQRIQQASNQELPVQDHLETCTPIRSDDTSSLAISVTEKELCSPVPVTVKNGEAPTAVEESKSEQPVSADEPTQEKEDIVRLDEILDISGINPNSLIVLDETVCSDMQTNTSVIDLDSDNEDTNLSNNDQSESTVNVISVESDEDDDDDDVIAISDDEGSSSLGRKRKLPNFIAVPDGPQFKKRKKLKRNGKSVQKKAEEDPSTPKVALGPLRPIVVDGSNVAFSHGKRSTFSAKGIKIIVDYFVERGHRVHVFVPQFRRRHPLTTDFTLMDEMESAGVLHYTPSRRVDGRLICSYDDRFIVEFAAQKKAIIITRDNYKDLMDESEGKPQWKETISRHLLQFTFVDDMVLFPDDPLGRNGPRLDEFLRFPAGETPL